MNFNGVLSNKHFQVFYDWYKTLMTEPEDLKKVHIEYQEQGGSWKRKRVRYNVKKDDEIQSRLFEVPLVDLSFEKFEEKPNIFRSIDFIYRFALSQPITVSMELEPDENKFGSIEVLLSDNAPNGYRFKFDAILRTIGHLMDVMAFGGVEFRYGFIAKMPREKNCLFYLNGIRNETLNEEENRELLLYDKCKRELSHVIWQPFWGNFITTRHLRNEGLKEELERLLGKNHFYRLNEHMYFLQMPIELDDFEYHSEKHMYHKEKIRAIFERHGAVLSL